MPKLKSQGFSHRNKAGELFEFTAEVTVLNDGIFSVSYPGELESTVTARFRDKEIDTAGVWSNDTKMKKRISGKDLRKIEIFLRAVIKDHLSCEVTESVIIAYSHKVDYTCVRNKITGELYPNGNYAKNYSEGGSEWIGDLNGSIGPFNSSHHYSIGVNAEVRKKIVYRRATYEDVKYERQGFDDDQLYGEMLNSLVGASMPSEFSEMPYTEDAAKFFYNVMMNICQMADRIETFFGDEDNVIKAIESQQPLLSHAPTEGK